jgi:hypothetical protein
MATLTTAMQVAALFKKSMGKPSTNINNAFYSEPSRPARPAVQQSQFYSEAIPDVAPADLASATTDELGATLTGSIVGKKSSAAPIKKYIKVPLVEVAGSNGTAFECALDATYGRVLQDAIPFNQDPAGSYLIHIYKSDGSEIPFGSGQWIVDCEAGVLTFYTTITGVSSSQLPTISFFRYVGAKGAQTSAQVVSAIANQAITFTAPETFAGGDTATTGDGLAAIQLDTRNLKTLSDTVPAMALQIGGDYDGSWRWVVFGGSNTSMQFQTRVSGSWVSKTAMFQQ